MNMTLRGGKRLTYLLLDLIACQLAFSRPIKTAIPF